MKLKVGLNYEFALAGKVHRGTIRKIVKGDGDYFLDVDGFSYQASSFVKYVEAAKKLETVDEIEI